VRRVKELFEEFEPPILVEEFIAGKELHVSILGNSPPQVLPVIEFDFSALPDNHPAIITYNVKWNPLDQAYHQVHSICPARLPAGIEHAVKEQALRAYQATSCRDYARVDMRLADSGTPYVLEVNPNPDLTESVSFMQSAEKSGLTFAQTLARIAEFALARGKGLRTMVSQQGG
jgi:D-alanine-D-alanine ligase